MGWRRFTLGWRIGQPSYLVYWRKKDCIADYWGLLRYERTVFSNFGKTYY
jgi:hypothetical protein